MARANKKDFSEFYVLINLSGPRYWKVSRESIQVVDAPQPGGAPVISFGDFDYRGFFENGVSRATAKKYFLREYSEKSRILYEGSKKPIYATPTHRLSEFDHALFPGSWYLDRLLQRDNIDFSEKDRIVGFSFEAGTEEEGNFSKIVVLYAWRTDGSLSFPEISLNPHDIQLVVSEFAKSNGVNLDELILYPTDDLLSLGQGVSYPVEEDVGGMSYSSIYQSLAGVFAIGFLAISAVNGWNYIQSESNKQEAAKIVAKGKKTKEEQNIVVQNNLYAYGNLSGIQPHRVFNAIENIYAPQINVVGVVADLKGGPEGKAKVQFITEEQPTGEHVPQEVIRYLTLQKDIVGIKRQSINYLTQGKKYEAIYSFQAVDDVFSDLTGR